MKMHWQTLKAIVPVAASVRREHWDLFARTGLSEARRNEDEFFYDALLHAIRNDPQFLKDFELRFISSRRKQDRRKSFVNRVMLWLERQSSLAGADLPDFRREAPPAVLAGSDTVAHELWGLVFQVVKDIKEEREGRVFGIEEEWQASRQALLDLLEDIESPTLDGVERLEKAAGLFLDLGGQWKKISMEIEKRRAFIRDRLQDCGEERPPVPDLLARLPGLDTYQVAALHDLARMLHGHLCTLAENDRTLEERVAIFDRQRRDQTPWSKLSRMAAEIAGLEEERLAADRAIGNTLAEMTVTAAERRPAGPVAPPPDKKASAPVEDESGPGRAPLGALAEPDSPVPLLPEEVPESWNGFEDWCAETFEGRLALSARARKSLKKALYQDVQAAGRCLSWLAGAYRGARLEGCGELIQGPLPGVSGFHNERCGGDAFEFSLDGQRRTADWHVKNGGNSRDPGRCLRIYYCWDEESSRVLIGDMPGHV